MTIMTQKDCEEWAAMIAQMEDDHTWHPKYNKKGDKTLPNERGPNDLEEQIRVLKFRNETLHKHTEKLMQEINTLRIENKRLEKEVAFYAKDQFRNRGEMRLEVIQHSTIYLKSGVVLIVMVLKP